VLSRLMLDTWASLDAYSPTSSGRANSEMKG
jgi:hypothetical protein